MARRQHGERPAMLDQTLARALLLCAIALAFGLGSLNYEIGHLYRAGPGLFPLVVASALLCIGVLTLIQAWFGTRAPADLQVRNIGLILLALVVFAVLSRFVNMTVGIVAMVFVASLASQTFSVRRTAAVAVSLVAIAFAFQVGLKLNLPMY